MKKLLFGLILLASPLAAGDKEIKERIKQREAELTEIIQAHNKKLQEAQQLKEEAIRLDGAIRELKNQIKEKSK